jgi:elongation factor G
VKDYNAGQIRNIALVGHQDTGKTTLAEAMLFAAGAIDRIGRVEDGHSTMDTSPEEQERKISIQASLAFCEHNNHKINLIDTPGYEDFVGEVLAPLDVVESGMMVVRADGGVEVGTEKVWTYLREKNLPTGFCINRMDKENANFDDTIKEMQEHFGRKVLPLQVPIGQGESFKGVVDLLSNKACEFSTDGKGKATAVDIPAELADKVDTWRRELFEAAAENDEVLMEKYLESDSLTEAEAIQGLAAGVLAGDLYPVACVSAEKNMGAAALLDSIVNLMPSPEQSPRSDTEGAELKADPADKAAAKIFKNVSESHVGDMLFVRVYRGALTGGRDIHNSTRNTGDRLGQLFYLQGKHRTETAKIVAGDMGAAVKLKNAHVGDTLCDKNGQVVLPPTAYPKPSIFSAISAAAKGDEDKIGAGLNRLKEEDPTFDVRVDGEVNQTLISGQGVSRKPRKRRASTKSKPGGGANTAMCGSSWSR